ncbi:hypothetical protein GOODEAATRI_001062, partial [Goodea atripinnis]
HVDWYDVTLEDTCSGLVRSTRIMGSAAPQSGFSSLVPGTMYNISVLARSGNKTAAPVHAITVTASSLLLVFLQPPQLWMASKWRHTLQASWTSPEGGVDFFTVTLRASGSTPQQQTLPPNVTQLVFMGLTPGRLYQLSVNSSAGGLSSENRAEGRTVPDQVSTLSMSIDNSKLQLSWSPPRGDWENYSILLTDGPAVLMNRTISKQSRQLLVSVQSLGLVPGRLYSAELTVNSGGLSNTAHCSSRLAPRSVQQLVIRHADETSLSVQWRQPVGRWDSFMVLLTDEDLATPDTQRILSGGSRECSFKGLTSGRRYTVTVTTNTPAPVSQLQVSNHGSTDSLQAHWELASGDQDSYQVLLVHDSSIIKNGSVVANISSIIFQNLRPGAQYKVVVTTVRAGLTSRQTVAEGRTGEVDSYLVTLRDRDRTLHTLAVSKFNPGCVFNSLISGRLYNISITSCSGRYENHTFIQERTREHLFSESVVVLGVCVRVLILFGFWLSLFLPDPLSTIVFADIHLHVVALFFNPLEPSKVQNPTATHGARDDYLKVYWRHAAGDFDLYQVFIKHNNTFQQNKTVQKMQSECVFTGLVPGRLYTVLVNTWSGSYEASASTHGRT